MQYADDTIMVGEMTFQNARALKCILRNFELAAGLKINFHKSCLIGVRSAQGLVEQEANILNCKIGALPFRFLGILLGRTREHLPLGIP